MAGQISTKEGFGGYGLQAYDTDDGKYVKVTLKVGDQTVSTFDEYLHIMKERHPEDADAINAQDPEALSRYSEKYSSAFRKKVDKMNEKRHYNFNDGKDLFDHMEKLFTPTMVNSLKKMCPNGYSNQINVSPYRNYTFDAVTVAFFNGRFGTAKFNAMSEEEFKELYESDLTDKRWTNKKFEFSRTGSKDTYDYLKSISAGKHVAWFRGLKHMKDDERLQKVAKGYIGDPDVLSNLSGSAGAGSGIYSMPSIDVVHTNVDGGYIINSGAVIHGLIKNVADLKIGISPSWEGGNLSDEAKKIRGLQNHCHDTPFKEKMAKCLQDAGFGDRSECEQMAKTISYKMGNDYGLAAAALGYDIITGYGCEFVILNPACVYMSTTYNK